MSRGSRTGRSRYFRGHLAPAVRTGRGKGIGWRSGSRLRHRRRRASWERIRWTCWKFSAPRAALTGSSDSSTVNSVGPWSVGTLRGTDPEKKIQTALPPSTVTSSTMPTPRSWSPTRTRTSCPRLSSLPCTFRPDSFKVHGGAFPSTDLGHFQRRLGPLTAGERRRPMIDAGSGLNHTETVSDAEREPTIRKVADRLATRFPAGAPAPHRRNRRRGIRLPGQRADQNLHPDPDRKQRPEQTPPGTQHIGRRFQAVP